MSGRESASRTLPRMRIGCGRLIAVLWTLLMKDASRLGKHHKGRLFLRQTSSAPLQKRYGKGRYNAGAEGGASGCSFGAGGGCDGRTYTLCGHNVYVLTRRGIRSARATDEAGTLSEGEGRAKVQALREGSGGLPAGKGYSKPPAGATRTAAGGFALAGVTQERERQGATYASEDPWHSGAHPYPRWRHRRSRSSSASRGYSTRS